MMSIAHRLCVLVATVMLIAADARSQFVPAGDESDTVYQKSNVGDPTVVPLILKLLDRCAVLPGEQHHNENYAAIYGVEMYRLEQAGPILVSIYQNPHTPVLMKSSLAEAAAAIHTPASKRFLTVVRDDPDVRLRTHFLVLVALVELNDDDARKELVDTYRKFLDAPPSDQPEMSNIPIALEKLGDAKVIANLQEMRDAEIDAGKKSAIAEVIAIMQMHDLPLEALFKIAEETDYTRVGTRRYHAIDIIAERAGLDAIPRIEALKPWTNTPPHRAQSMMRMFPGMRQAAVLRIRRTHWRELLQHPATAPAKDPE